MFWGCVTDFLVPSHYCLVRNSGMNGFPRFILDLYCLVIGLSGPLYCSDV